MPAGAGASRDKLSFHQLVDYAALDTVSYSIHKMLPQP